MTMTTTRVIVTVIAQAQTPTTTALRVKHLPTPTSRQTEANRRVPIPGGRSGQGRDPRSLTREARSARRPHSLRKADGRGRSIPTVLPRYLDRVASHKAFSGRLSPGPATHVDKTVIELLTAPASRGSSVDGSVSISVTIRCSAVQTWP